MVFVKRMNTRETVKKRTFTVNRRIKEYVFRVFDYMETNTNLKIGEILCEIEIEKF